MNYAFGCSINGGHVNWNYEIRNDFFISSKDYLRVVFIERKYDVVRKAEKKINQLKTNAREEYIKDTVNFYKNITTLISQFKALV